MMNDPIVDEVRAVRERIAEEFNYDVGAICQNLRERIARGEFKVVRLPSKPATQMEKRAFA
jgi:hypothetical protein